MPTLPSSEPARLRPRVDFREEQFRRLVLTKGVEVTWEMCAECPCSRKSSDLTMTGFLAVGQSASQTGESRPDCPTCDGRGYFWHSEQEIKAIVASGQGTGERRDYGDYLKGEIRVSLLPEHLPGYGDRFTMKDSVLVYKETLVRKAGVLQKTRYPIESRSLSLRTGETTLDVLQMIKADSDGLTQVGATLTKDTDFTVNAQGQIDFTLGDALGSTPAVGEHFSISYYAKPRYYVQDHPHTHRDTREQRKKSTEQPLNMLVQCTAALEFLGGRDG
jgi:hypothetical protein